MFSRISIVYKNKTHDYETRAAKYLANMEEETVISYLRYTCNQYTMTGQRIKTVELKTIYEDKVLK